MALIDVLMATYNGEQFIDAQISSIVSQSFQNWKLIIHDDGSSDNTINIIKKWMQNDSRIVLIEDGIKCGGAAKNFLYLTKFSDAPYCMFCDQDDIWFNNKIETFYKSISDKPTDIPIAAYGRTYLWKQEIGIMGIAGWDAFPYNLKQFICENAGIQGCSSICNKAAIEYLKHYTGRIAMHDHLLNLVVLVFGYAIPIHTPLMLYRQHTANVTGSSSYNFPLYRRILKSLIHVNPVIDNLHYNAIKDFYDNYKEVIDASKCKDLELYLKMPYKNRLGKIKTVLNRGWSRNGSKLKLIFKIILHPYINKE